MRQSIENKKSSLRETYHKAGFTSRKRKKEYGRFVRTPFHTPCLQGIVVTPYRCTVGRQSFLVICLARLGVIFLLRKSDITPDGRSDILFAFVM